MERISVKLACFFLLFMAASLLASSVKAQISIGPNKKQLFITGRLCKSHSDCYTNSVYSINFCFNKMSGSQIGHCVGFGSTLALLSEKKDEKRKPMLGACGYCVTDEDCRDCHPTAGCDHVILPNICV